MYKALFVETRKIDYMYVRVYIICIYVIYVCARVHYIRVRNKCVRTYNRVKVYVTIKEECK